jgi:hypothetical protein
MTDRFRRQLASRSGSDPGATGTLLSRTAAALYLGISPNIFDLHVRIAPVRAGSRKLWDLKALGAWIDKQSGL